MKIEKENLIAHAKEKKAISIPEIQMEFSMRYHEVFKLVNELIQEEVLKYSSGIIYEYVANEEAEESAQDDSQEDEDTSMDDRAAYIEARRRALMERVKRINDGDDEDEDNETEDDEEEDEQETEEQDLTSDEETYDDVEDIDIDIQRIMRFIRYAVGTVREGELIFLTPFQLDKNRSALQFELLKDNDKIYLSDRGHTLLDLQDRVNLATDGVYELVGQIADRYDVQKKGSELRIEISAPYKSIICLMRLCSAVECINHIDEDFLPTSSGYKSEHEEKEKIISRTLIRHPDLDRNQAIAFIWNKIKEAKKKDDFKAMVAHAKAMKDFVEMTDDMFESLRKINLAKNK